MKAALFIAAISISWASAMASSSGCESVFKRQSSQIFECKVLLKYDGTPGPCLDFRGTSLVYVTFENLDLKGSVFGDNLTYGTAFRIYKSDLRFSKFESIADGQGFSIWDSNLIGADLGFLELFYKDPTSDLPPSQIIDLRGSTFDKTTALPKKNGVQITAAEAIELGMINSD